MNKKHILVVEDEQMTARLVVYRLKALGHNVVHKDNGVEGLDYILKERPEVLVLDVMLPGMSGFEILENLRDSEEIDRSSMKVLMLTTKSRTEDISRGFDLGAVEYIPKPFKMDEFLLRLNRVMNS
ncbi:MAG: response regulator [Balneolaceae bacterium]